MQFLVLNISNVIEPKQLLVPLGKTETRIRSNSMYSLGYYEYWITNIKVVLAITI